MRNLGIAWLVVGLLFLRRQLGQLENVLLRWLLHLYVRCLGVPSPVTLHIVSHPQALCMLTALVTWGNHFSWVMAGFQEKMSEAPGQWRDMLGTGTMTHQPYSFIGQSGHKASQIQRGERNKFLVGMWPGHIVREHAGWKLLRPILNNIMWLHLHSIFMVLFQKCIWVKYKLYKLKNHF